MCVKIFKLTVGTQMVSR